MRGNPKKERPVVSIRIPFGEKHIITSDQHGYQLCEKAVHGPDTKKAGEKYLKPVKYWCTLTALFRGLSEHSVRNSDATTLDEIKALLSEHTRLVTEIRAVLDGEGENHG